MNFYFYISNFMSQNRLTKFEYTLLKGKLEAYLRIGNYLKPDIPVEEQVDELIHTGNHPFKLRRIVNIVTGDTIEIKSEDIISTF